MDKTIEQVTELSTLAEPQQEVKLTKAGKPRRKSENWKKSPIIGNNGLQTKPGDNTRYVLMARDLVSFPPIDKTDIQALENRFMEYVQYCAEHDLKPGNMTCYSALGIDKNTAWEWSKGISGTREQRDFIKKVVNFCSNTREMLMQDNKVNVVTGIFWQKNYDGLVDKQEVTITPNLQQDTDFDPEDIRKRYLTDYTPIDVTDSVKED